MTASSFTTKETTTLDSMNPCYRKVTLSLPTSTTLLIQVRLLRRRVKTLKMLSQSKKREAASLTILIPMEQLPTK